MKLNLLLDNDKVLNGYLNVDPFAKPGDAKIQCDLSNLDAVVDDGEAELIIADNVLDYYGRNLLPAILSNWVRKLEKGGKLVITGPDLYEITRAVQRHEVDEETANTLIYGEQNKDWQTKKNAFSMKRIEQLLTQLGLKVNAKFLFSFRYTIEAERA